MSTDRRRLGLSLVISTVAVAAALIHLIFPKLAIDTITLYLLTIAVLPWLGQIFESITFPGGAGVKYRDLAKVENAAARVGLLAVPAETREPVYASFSQDDPNLALAGLQLELERRMKAMANAWRLDTGRKSSRQLMTSLTRAGALSQEEYSVLSDLSGLLNQAVHGASVDPAAGEWARSVGPRLLAALDERTVSRGNPPGS